MTMTPEILAPAGNAACALAAYDAGADAVYAGLPRFNARERGENFDLDSMGRLAAYARANHRKLYVTRNTLIKETELDDAAAMLAEVAKIGPDAVIVQDLGILRLAREYFPELTLHASTQMGVHNRPGLEMASRLGIKRVILERQLTLDEIAGLCEDSPVELEVFVHGALCCSLSGQCLLSSWLGGASGNRGKCKQPCRRRFYRPEGNGFFFSTGDLCALEMVRGLTRLGVASFKIEGRLRQPDYVHNAVRAYRSMVDAPDDAAAREALGEARRLLSETCGRRWTGGFLTGDGMKQLIQHEALGAAGMLVGRVEKAAAKGFSFTAKKKIRIGDRLRVQPTSGDEGPALTLTRMRVDDQPVRSAAPGQRCFICCDKPVPPNGLVFKLGTNLNIPIARLDRVAPPPARLDLEVGLYADRLSVRIANLPEFPEWRHAWQLAPAAKHGVDAGKVAAEFAVAVSTGGAVGRLTAFDCPNPELFLPAAELKAARRECFRHLAASLDPAALRSPEAAALERFRNDYASMRAAAPRTERETVAMRPRGDLPGNPKARRAVSILDFGKTTEEAILPEFVAPGQLESLKRMIAEAYRSGIRRFRAAGLYALILLEDYSGVEIVTGFPLPVANALAALELAKFGVIQVQAEPELDKEALTALIAKSPLPVEVYRFGRLPLLVTRAEVPVEGRITDGRDTAFLVRRDRRGGLTRVLAEKVLSLPRIPGAADFYDLTNAYWQEKISGDFNFNAEWL